MKAWMAIEVLLWFGLSTAAVRHKMAENLKKLPPADVRHNCDIQAFLNFIMF